MVLQLRDKGDRWTCHIHGCRTEIALQRGTCEGSRLPLRNIILFIYCWSREYSSIEFMQYEVGIGRDATADLLAHPVIIRGPNSTLKVLNFAGT